MIFGIITLILGVVTFIMFSQPVFAVYGSEAGATIFDKLGLNNNNCYNIIKFEKGQNTYLTVGNVS